MRKSLSILVLTSFLTSCTSISHYLENAELPNPPFTKDQLVGKWKCQGTYKKASAKSTDIYYIKGDGTATNDGKMIVDASSPLEYEYSIKGKWNLDGWFFMQHQTEAPKVKRIHSVKTLNALKTDKKLQELDKKYYDALSTKRKSEDKILYANDLVFRTNTEQCEKTY